MERTRHLICCLDGSTIGGHGYIVIPISVMFDVAAIFSDEEYFLKYEENVCVQSVVEKPSLYRTGRCPSTDRQLLYSDIRIEDIPLLRENLETSDDIPIRDKLRMFKRDSSTHLSEAGQQKEGFFFFLFLQYSRKVLGKSLIYTIA